MRNGKPITLEQLLDVAAEEIAWLRIYPNGQRLEYFSFMGLSGIREARILYGDKTVLRVMPGYHHAIVWVDR